EGPVAALDALQQRLVRLEQLDLVPAHMRHRQAAPARKRLDAPGEPAEAGYVTYGGALEQELHAHADAEHWLLQAAQAIDKAVLSELRHARCRRADTHQDDTLGRGDGLRIKREDGTNANPLEREQHAVDVLAPAGDDGDGA